MGEASRQERDRRHRVYPAEARALLPAGPTRQLGQAVVPARPPVGAWHVNEHGLEFRVLEHITIPACGKRSEPAAVPGHSLERIVPEPIRIEAPVVSIGGFSERLFRLLSEFDGISPKAIIFVDTHPAGIAHGMQFGGHSFNWQFHPEVAFLTIHSPDTTEDILAHELMHGWLDLVMGYEDDRVYRDHDDHAALHLINWTQCAVLDCMVQDAIGARGFDPCCWTAEVVDCLYDDGIALAHDVYPATRYEASFVAKLYALPEAVPHLFRFDSALAEKYAGARTMIRAKMPDLAQLGDEVARAFREGSYRNREDARRLIDRCLLLTADYVGMDLDLERDLVAVPPPDPTWTDKFPEMLPGLPPQLKYEVHRRLLREDWPAGTLVEASAGNGGSSVHVAFYPPSRSGRTLPPSSWEWRLPQPLALPRSSYRVHEDTLLGASPAARLRPRSWELLQMGAPQPPSTSASAVTQEPVPRDPGVSAISQLPDMPVQADMSGNVPPTTPAITAGRPAARPHADGVEVPRSRRGGPTMRHYLPGLGRFISRVRLHEAVALRRTTYQELRDTWGVNIGPLGTPEAFAGSRMPEHPYTYAESNPVNRVDPAGLQSCRPGHDCQRHPKPCPKHGAGMGAMSMGGGGKPGGTGKWGGGSGAGGPGGKGMGKPGGTGKWGGGSGPGGGGGMGGGGGKKKQPGTGGDGGKGGGGKQPSQGSGGGGGQQGERSGGWVKLGQCSYHPHRTNAVYPYAGQWLCNCANDAGWRCSCPGPAPEAGSMFHIGGEADCSCAYRPRFLKRCHCPITVWHVVGGKAMGSPAVSYGGRCVSKSGEGGGGGPCGLDPATEPCLYAWHCPPTAQDRAIQPREAQTWVGACQACCSALFTASPNELQDCWDGCFGYIPPSGSPPIPLPDPLPFINP